MSNREYKSREELKNECQDFKERQNAIDADYEAKVESGQASGFDKFCHFVNKILTSFVDSLEKRL